MWTKQKAKKEIPHQVSDNNHSLSTDLFIYRNRQQPKKPRRDEIKKEKTTHDTVDHDLALQSITKRVRSVLSLVDSLPIRDPTRLFSSIFSRERKWWWEMSKKCPLLRLLTSCTSLLCWHLPNSAPTRPRGNIFTWNFTRENHWYYYQWYSRPQPPCLFLVITCPPFKVLISRTWLYKVTTKPSQELYLKTFSLIGGEKKGSWVKFTDSQPRQMSPVLGPPPSLGLATWVAPKNKKK